MVRILPSDDRLSWPWTTLPVRVTGLLTEVSVAVAMVWPMAPVSITVRFWIFAGTPTLVETACTPSRMISPARAVIPSPARISATVGELLLLMTGARLLGDHSRH